MIGIQTCLRWCHILTTSSWGIPFSYHELTKNGNCDILCINWKPYISEYKSLIKSENKVVGSERLHRFLFLFLFFACLCLFLCLNVQISVTITMLFSQCVTSSLFLSCLFSQLSLSLSLLFQRSSTNRDIGPAVRVFANGPGDLGSIPGRVIPKTLKMELDTTLLNTQHYKVRFKGKVEQSREWSSALPYTLV